MKRLETYATDRRTDSDKAFDQNYDNVEAAQRDLRDIDPKSSLLGLVTLRKDRSGLLFGKPFIIITGERSGWERDNNPYTRFEIYQRLVRNEIGRLKPSA